MTRIGVRVDPPIRFPNQGVTGKNPSLDVERLQPRQNDLGEV
jgi:hypothetical protein